MQLSNSLTPRSISSSSYLLRQYGGAAAAYSLQRLDTSTENVLRSREGVGDTEADFTAEEVRGGALRDFALQNDADLIRFADQASASDKRMYCDSSGSFQRAQWDSSVVLTTATGWRLDMSAMFKDTYANGYFGQLGLDGVYQNSATSWTLSQSGVASTGVTTSSLNPFQLYRLSFRCDGVNFYIYDTTSGSDVLLGQNSVGSVTSITFDMVGVAAGREMDGIIYDVKVSNTGNNTTWVAEWNGYGNENADWTDQVGSNDGTVVGSPALFSGQGFDAYVTTLYDQSGNGRDATQATAASQPQIVADGVVVTDSNGNPAMLFDGTDDSLVTASFSAAQPITTFVKFSYTVASNAVFDGTGANRHLLDETGGNWRIFAGAGLVGGAVDTNENVGAALYNSTSSSLYINGSSQVSGNAGTQGINAGLRLGTNNGSADPLNGSLSEFALYASDKSSDRASIEANIAARYGITLA